MIVGHQRQIRYLERVLERGTLAHAYLFHGPDGVGKKTAALAAARSLLCDKKKAEFGGCGKCEACIKAEAGAHPDLFTLSPDGRLVEEESRVGLGIKNIHELKRRLGLSAWAGGWKVAVIDSAEALSREAQSALLKILEEPGRDVVFFLVSSVPGVLLPTIRSRSVEIGFAPVGGDELEPLLKSAPAARRPELLGLAAGRPGMLRRMIEDRAFFESWRSGAARFVRIIGEDLVDQFVFSDEAGREPERLRAFVEFLVRHLRSELLAVLHSAERVKAMTRLLKMVLERSAVLDSVPVNRRLLTDSVFFELQGVGRRP